MTQKDFIRALCDQNPEAIIVASLGSISYDLTETYHDNKIFIRGAMGAAVPCGLGYALSTDKQVIVLVGDGSFLMKLGALSTVLKHNRPNLKIVIMNNGCYRSCGGQKTNFEYIRPLLPDSIQVVDVE